MEKSIDYRMKGDVFKIELEKKRNPKPQTEQKYLPTLIMEGKINSAMRFPNGDISRGILPLSNHVMLQLYEKHLETMPAKSSVLLRGPVEDIQQGIYFQINSETVREAALKTKGSAGGPVVRMLMELREFLLVNLLIIHH